MGEHLVFCWNTLSGGWKPLVLDGKQLKVDSKILPEMFTIAALHEIEPLEFEGASRVYVMGMTRYEPATVFNTPASTISTDNMNVVEANRFRGQFPLST